MGLIGYDYIMSADPSLMGLVPLKRGLTKLPHSLHHVRTQQEAIHDLGSWLSPDTKSDNLTLNFLVSRIMINKYLLFNSPKIFVIADYLNNTETKRGEVLSHG